MSTRAWTLAIVIGASAIAADGQTSAPQAQRPPAPAGTGLIIGRVIDGATGVAITGVAVTIGGPNAPRTGNSVLVDSQGRFLFTGLTAGTFTLTAQKNGYISTAYGRTRPGGQSQSLELRDDERRTDATLRMWRWGSIAGRVVDEAGEPVSGASVEAYQRTWVAGHPSLSTTGGRMTTDDRGWYRTGQLLPGEYVVGITSRLITFPIAFVESDGAARQAGGAAQQARAAELAAKGSNMLGTFPGAASTRIGDFTIARSDGPITPLPAGNDRLSIFPVTFHPAAPTSELATAITLAPGEQRRGVDLHLRLVPTVRISGVASGPNGPIENLGLRLQLGYDSQMRSRRLIEPAQTVTAANGAFTFLGVPPGSYVIIATTAPPQGDALSVELPVAVGDRDLVDVVVTLRPNPRVSGRVEFDGTAEKPAFRTLGASLGLDPADGHLERQSFPIDPDGTIPARSVLPGKYFVRVDTRSGVNLGAWTLKSAMLNGRDVSDVALTIDATDVAGLVVTFTDHPPALAGTVRTAQNAADASAAVLVFPADKALWIDHGSLPRRLRSVRPDRTGAFTVPALPPGEYFAIAIPEDMGDNWQRQAFLARAAGLATRVTIDDGKNAAVDLITKRWQQ